LRAKNHLPEALQGPLRRRRAISNLDKMLRLPLPPGEPLLLPAALSTGPVPAGTPRVREMLVNLRRQFLRRRSTLQNLISAIITDRTPKLLLLHNKVRLSHETNIHSNQFPLNPAFHTGFSIRIKKSNEVPLLRKTHPEKGRFGDSVGGRSGRGNPRS